MKRLFVAIATLALTAGIASAQDFNAAVETFNMGAQTLEANKAEALSQFKSALAQFEACEEEEAAEMVAKCKEIIPQTILSIAKEQINNSEYDEAVATLKEAASVAGEYGIDDVVADANELIPNAWLRKGSALLKAKDYANAAVALKEVVALTPEDGQNWLLLGQSLMQAGDNDGAVAALTSAADNGKAEQANKLLSNLFLREGMNLVKAGKSAEAIEALTKSNGYVESSNAYKLIASAYTKLDKSGQAIEAYKKYLEIAPDAKDAADVMFTIAATAQKAGDKATAIDYYKKLSSNAKYAAQAAQQLGALQK
ncbi:MAG: tetratricopeptide repeat protein [Bacteroidales bacterium]|nr:tetratricopeptide repeat protein [Bacteroidales bacterium]